MFISSKSCSDIQSWKKAAGQKHNNIHQHETRLCSCLQSGANAASRTQRRVHQDGVVELGGGLSDVDRLHLLEAAQRVTLWDELRDGPLVQRAGDQQDHVINHVAVPAQHQKCGFNQTINQTNRVLKSLSSKLVIN